MLCYRLAIRKPNTIVKRTQSTIPGAAATTRATGNLPLIKALWTVKYRAIPIARTKRPKRTVVAPNGRAKAFLDEALGAMVKSCTRATPVETIARLVLTYARKVRSEARWSLATLPEFSRVRLGLNRSLFEAEVVLLGNSCPVVAGSSCECCSECSEASEGFGASIC